MLSCSRRHVKTTFSVAISPLKMPSVLHLFCVNEHFMTNGPKKSIKAINKLTFVKIVHILCKFHHRITAHFLNLTHVENIKRLCKSNGTPSYNILRHTRWIYYVFLYKSQSDRTLSLLLMVEISVWNCSSSSFLIVLEKTRGCCKDVVSGGRKKEEWGIMAEENDHIEQPSSSFGSHD